MAAADQRQRRLGRPENAHRLVERRCARKRARKALRLVLVLAGDDEACEPAERRIVGALARLDLGVVECLAILRDQRAHHRMLGLPGLEIAVALGLESRRRGRSPAAAIERCARRRADRPMSSQYPRRSRRPAKDAGKWCPLATSWVPMTISNSPREIAVDFGAQPLRAAGKIRGEGENPRPRKKRRRFLGQSLDAGAAGGERIRPPRRPGIPWAFVRDGRNDGTSAPAGNGVRRARRCSSGTETMSAGAAKCQAARSPAG